MLINKLSMQETVDKLSQDFNLIKSWDQRLFMLIAIGSKAPIIDQSKYSITFNIEGCASKVELLFNNQDRLIEGYADSLIIKGLIEYLFIVIELH